jgi:hypothetical protein
MHLLSPCGAWTDKCRIEEEMRKTQSLYRQNSLGPEFDETDMCHRK